MTTSSKGAETRISLTANRLDSGTATLLLPAELHHAVVTPPFFFFFFLTRFCCDLQRLEVIKILGFYTFKVLRASRGSESKGKKSAKIKPAFLC